MDEIDDIASPHEQDNSDEAHRDDAPVEHDAGRPKRASRHELPAIEDVMRKEYLVIEDVAVLLSVSVEGVRTRIKLGTVPQPKRRGRRLYWKKSVFLDWMDDDGDDTSGSWTPPRPKPRPSGPSARQA